MQPVTVAGLDAARSGWVACVIGPGAAVDLRVGAHLGEVWDERWVAVGIDMPMGLPVDAPRPADAEARSILGRRHTTLFPTPAHATLGTADHADAVTRSRAAIGRGLSRQAWHLLPRVAELRAFLGGPRPGVWEAHPDTSFTVMNGGAPLPSKHTAAGRAARIERLGRWRRWPGWSTASADGLDAGAAAWTATRVAAGRHRVLGDPTTVDPDGYPLTMAV